VVAGDVAEVRRALAELDGLLRERVNEGFRSRLLGHRPTAALLTGLAGWDRT
jgi:hypothetical protein